MSMLSRLPFERQIRYGCLALAVLFLLIYLEWGNRGAFIFQMTGDIIRQGTRESVTHPLVIGPLVALVLLLAGAACPRLPRWLLLAASLPPVAVALIALIGSVGRHSLPTLLSVIPFLSAWVLMLRRLLRR